MSLTTLVRLRLAGRLCRIGSWFILAVGLIVSICLFFAITSDSGPDGPSPTQWLLSIAIPGIVVLITSFFFLFLFTAGAWLEDRSTSQDSQEKQSSQEMDREKHYEYVEITSLPR